jgi:predicted nuclease of restriction endonuclease-like (RecB) superfamily
MPPKKSPQLYNRIHEILESARAGAARSVNTAQVMANWLVGQELVEEEQKGRKRADYGKKLIATLSTQLTTEFGRGYSVNNLEHFRDFYLTYPELLNRSISHALRGKSFLPEVFPSADKEPGMPGRLNPNLSWTHYRTLLRVSRPEARTFYEIESIKNNWSARELERQISTMLYERLALSKDKKGLLRLATKGQEIQESIDVFKDPVVIEFLGLPESPRLVESRLEQALINNLQTFLLELGKGFAFVSRQERITLDGDHFYIDLVFYHTVLKCYVLVDLKVGKLSHGDLGQLQFYVNYFDCGRRTEGDNPTLGLILCMEKNDAVVQYTLGEDQQKGC